MEKKCGYPEAFQVLRYIPKASKNLNALTGGAGQVTKDTRIIIGCQRKELAQSMG